MGFIYEKYQDNHCILISSFQGDSDTEEYFSGNNLDEAINYFNLYFKEGQLYLHTDDELALEATGVESITEANELREKINNIIASFDNEQALDNIILFPKWTKNKDYKINDKVRYNDILYKVLQSHTSLENWTPDVASSLFARVLINEDEEIINEWEQPSSANAYMTGDKVRFNNKIYQSLIDNNVWSPDDYPAGWQIISE